MMSKMKLVNTNQLDISENFEFNLFIRNVIFFSQFFNNLLNVH
jgi:hypothetical protein